MSSRIPFIPSLTMAVLPDGIAQCTAGTVADPAQRRAVIVAGCPGLAGLAEKYEFTAYVVTTCPEKRVWDTLSLLQKVAYAASDEMGLCWPDHESRWSASYLGDRKRMVSGPMERTSKAILMKLPTGMTGEQFDIALARRLRRRAIGCWAASKEGIRHCRSRRLDPAGLRRKAARPDVVQLARLPASDLIAFNAGNEKEVVWLEQQVLAAIAEKPTIEDRG